MRLCWIIRTPAYVRDKLLISFKIQIIPRTSNARSDVLKDYQEVKDANVQQVEEGRHLVLENRRS
jgi:hypothetical protein